MSAEKRRYFRISDYIGLAFRIVKPQAPDLKLSTDIIGDAEILEMLDTELDTLLNTLWSSDPKYARAIGLLNQKINLLMGRNSLTEAEILDQYEYYFEDIEVNLSASGIAFTTEVKLDIQDRVELLLLLKPTKTKLTVIGSVVNTQENDLNGKTANFVCVDFDLEEQQQEQLIQHIVQRQVESIGQKKEAL